jgi:O-methyltransferase involved in polyketide biosynthesis
VTGSRANFRTGDKVEEIVATPAECWPAEPALFDTSTPNIARVYDYWLGGKDNYAADRAEAERLIAVYPWLPFLARQSRLFLARAVQWLAKQGVTQFLDLGCGLPTGQNTHEIAQAVHPDCRVVYADADPIVVAHARALLQGPGVTAIRGDIAEPDAILAEVRAQRLVNLAEPTAIVLAMVLHFFDAATVSEIVTTFARAVPPGSYLVLSVGSGDEETGDALTREYQAGTLHNHSFKQIAAFVEDLELVPPGVTDAMAWIPGSPSQPPPPQPGGRILAGVGRKSEADTQVSPLSPRA